MRIRGKKLAAAAAEAGLTPADLARAVERTGLKGPAAESAVRNWMAGRDHPRCRASDIAGLARALSCEARDLAAFTSLVRAQRGSDRKVGLVAAMVRGQRVDKALDMLTFTTKRAAVNVKKALQAAIAEAESADADVTRLFVTEARVDKGQVLKRFQPKDRGRAHPILKRMSHVTVSVEERS